MAYQVVYDITREPPFAIESAWLAGGFFLLGAVWALVRKRQQRSATTGYVLMGFGSLIALLFIGVMSWDHTRLIDMLERGEAQVVSGPVGTRVRTSMLAFERSLPCISRPKC
jgi:hypothetical protein